MSPGSVSIRPAARDDAQRLAELHVSRIGDGFLSSLGVPFLTLLYRRIVVAPGSFARVATIDGRVVGFAAGATNVRALYRDFLLRDGIVAGMLAAPRLVRSWRRVWETLRYPASGDALPDAEILAVAVDAAEAGRGIGRRVVGAALEELVGRGVVAARVVTGSDNRAALALYRACGFDRVITIAVHTGTPSEVLVWNSSSR